MTEMAPEQPTPDEVARRALDLVREAQEHQIKATGTFEDGIVTANAELGGAKVTIAWHVDDDADFIDLLVGAIPDALEAVLTSLKAQQREADGE